MKPEHNCPKCPHCGATCGVPIERADWNHRADADRGHNLACPACGGGWEASAEDLALAWVAQLAWDARLRAESWNQRSGWYDGARVSMEGV